MIAFQRIANPKTDTLASWNGAPVYITNSSPTTAKLVIRNAKTAGGRVDVITASGERYLVKPDELSIPNKANAIPPKELSIAC